MQLDKKHKTFIDDGIFQTLMEVLRYHKYKADVMRKIASRT